MLSAISVAVSQYIETPTFKNVCGCLSLSGGTILASCLMLTNPLSLLGACGCCSAPVALFFARYGFLIHLVLVFFLVPTLLVLAVWYVIIAIQQAAWIILPLVFIGMPIFLLVEMRVLELLRCLYRVLRAGGTGWEMMTAEELSQQASDSSSDPLLMLFRDQRGIVSESTLLKGEECFADYKSIDIIQEQLNSDMGTKDDTRSQYIHNHQLPHYRHNKNTNHNPQQHQASGLPNQPPNGGTPNLGQQPGADNGLTFSTTDTSTGGGTTTVSSSRGPSGDMTPARQFVVSDQQGSYTNIL
eukprot:Lankesteria_metandrocarpae@DN1984_c0_g1_i1.p1